jgi:hypothetical protein
MAKERVKAILAELNSCERPLLARLNARSQVESSGTMPGTSSQPKAIRVQEDDQKNCGETVTFRR